MNIGTVNLIDLASAVQLKPGQRMVRVADNTWIPVGVGGNFMPVGTSGSSAEYYKCASVSEGAAAPEGATFTMQLTLKSFSATFTYHWIMDDTSKTGLERTWSGSVDGDNTSHTLHFIDPYWQIDDGLGTTIANVISEDPWDITSWYNLDGGDVQCAFSDISPAASGSNTWSGYKAVFDSTAGTWSFESSVTEGLAYTSVTPVVGGIYSADALIKISSMWNGVPSENLVFYLPLSETTIADVGPELTSSGTIVHTAMNGIQCAYFNGSSYLYASSVAMPTGASPRALSLWFRYKDIPGTTSSDTALFAGWGMTTSLGRFDAYVEAQGLYMIYSGSDLDSGIKIQDTNWHHVLMQYDGATTEIYYDGQLAASEAKTLNTRNNSLYIGARENGEFKFNGYLAGIRIYNRLMNSTEIAYLASEFTPTA